MEKEHVELLIRIDERQEQLKYDFGDFRSELKATMAKHDKRITTLENARQRAIGIKEAVIGLTSGGVAAGLLKFISYLTNK